MKISVVKESVDGAKRDVFVFYSEDQFNKLKNSASKDYEKEVAKKIGKNEFCGKQGQLTKLNYGEKRIFLVGLGKDKGLDGERVRRSSAVVVNNCICMKIENFFVCLDVVGIEQKDVARYVGEGLLLGEYRFDKYKTENKKERVKLKDVGLICCDNGNLSDCKNSLKYAELSCAGTNFTRDLQNDNADVVTPLYLEKKAKEIGKKYGIKVTVLDEKKLKKLGAGLILAVGKGSKYPPRIVILEYIGDSKSKEKIAVIGKGITFDSGGLNLKPTNYIETMKCDMSGAGAVLGTMVAVAGLKLKKNVIGIVSTAENACGAASYKPGDVYVGLSGKSVEIGNTDAEGRLVLADALAYAEKYLKPTKIIDIATLTGSVVVALGDYVAGMMGTDDEMIKKIFDAGESCHERVWEFPLYEDYIGEVKSDIADFNNINYGRNAGSIMGGAFLSKFVENTPWVHIDIAGPAYLDKKGRHYYQKGGTGFGVRLMVEYIKVC